MLEHAGFFMSRGPVSVIHLLTVPLSVGFVHEYARGHGRVERFDASLHRDADISVGESRGPGGEAVPFIAYEKCTRRRIVRLRIRAAALEGLANANLQTSKIET